MTAGYWARAADAVSADAASAITPTMRRDTSGIEAAEVFGIHATEIITKLFRGKAAGGALPGFGVGYNAGCTFAGFTDLDRSMLEQLIGGEDGGIHAQRDGDRIGRSRIDADQLGATLDDELRVVGVLDDASDDHALEGAAEPEDDGD